MLLLHLSCNQAELYGLIRSSNDEMITYMSHFENLMIVLPRSRSPNLRTHESSFLQIDRGRFRKASRQIVQPHSWMPGQKRSARRAWIRAHASQRSLAGILAQKLTTGRDITIEGAMQFSTFDDAKSGDEVVHCTCGRPAPPRADHNNTATLKEFTLLVLRRHSIRTYVHVASSN